MHPTKFNNKLTFFCCGCFYDNASPCCNLTQKRGKRRDSIDPASLHWIGIKTDRPV